MSQKFNPRLTRPTKGNKFYITKSSGGYSSAIKGKVKTTGTYDKDCDVLANCVGYAHGRFHEAINDTKMSYTCPVNAENFPEYTKCKMGNEPKLGAIIVWRKGPTLKSSDGAGHVAVVEKIFKDGSILISQSGYNSTIFWTARHEKGTDGNWVKGDDYSWMKSGYTFRCFIYPPVEFTPEVSVRTLKKGDSGSDVKELQEQLLKLGYKIGVDGSFGKETDIVVREFQEEHNLTVDGYVGPATQEAIAQAIEYLNKPNGVDDLSIIIDGKEYTCWSTNIRNENYIRLKDLVPLGLAKSVSYNKTKKKPEVKTK